MASKLTIPRPAQIKKVQPQAIALDTSDLEDEDADNTEPSGPPVVIEVAPAPKPTAPVAKPAVKPAPIPPPPAFVMAAAPIPPPPAFVTPAPAPAPMLSVTLGPARPSDPILMREVQPSLPSQYELDSERKSSPPIAERRKQLAKYVASAVGVAWFICTCAIGETAFRSIIASMH